MIDVKEKGAYKIAIHRYPQESGLGFNEVAPLGDDIDGGNPYQEGTPIAVSEVKLKVGEQESSTNVDDVAQNAVFELELEPGEQELKTWLIDQAGIEVGAYYVYLKKI